MKEKNDRQNSRSRYQGPRSERIKSGIEEIKKRRRDDAFKSGRELRMMKDFTPLQEPLISDREEETGDQEQGRQIKVESIGKTLGRNREAGSDTGDSAGAQAGRGTARREKQNDRSDFGKSRKKPLSRSERKKLSRQDSEKTDTEGAGSKTKASGALSDRSAAGGTEKGIGSSSFSNDGRMADVDLIFGEDLTRDESGRMKLFFNTRQSNYSGTRAERLEEKNKRLEIEGQFQDVVPYITPEVEEEAEEHSGRRWGKLGLEIVAFLLLYEIVILAAFAFKPDFRVNVSGQVLEMRESLMDRFASKKAPEETEEEQVQETTEMAVMQSTEDTSAYPAFVNEQGAIAVKSPGTPIEAAAIGTGDSDPVELLFGGDVYLSDHVMEAYRSAGSISGVVSEGYQGDIAAADYFVVNEEFPFSTGGKQAENKQFTFRVSPDNVNIFGEMGIDLVTLANNHTLDYGTEALLDTITTLDDAGIRHIGAGEDLSHAEEFVTVSIKGKKIAFVGATRVIPEPEWAAGESSAGVFSAYDDAELLKKIKDAKEQADFVVVYVHWGEERMESPNEVQKTLAHNIVSAGADLVIGAHPHVLQGIEYYQGVPIVYSLGNFVFGSSIPRTALLRVTIDKESAEVEPETAEEVSPSVEVEEAESSESADEASEEKTSILKLQLIPGTSSAGYTKKLDDVTDIAGFYSYITGISSGISIDGEGVIHQN